MAERPEDLNLPNSVIARIIKEALPDGINVSKDARLAISKAASVFVLYATSCANNFAMNHKRKTIAPQDVVEAMKEMEFDRFVETLKQSLEAYKDEQKVKRASAQMKKKEKEDSETAVPEREDEQKEEVEEEEVVMSEEEQGNEEGGEEEKDNEQEG